MGKDAKNTQVTADVVDMQGEEIKGIKDLVSLNMKALSAVNAGTMDNRKAVVLFMGTRTVTGALKLALEAKKAGIVEIAGVEMVTPAIPDGNGEGKE